ncbi:MAG: hypothetical protein KF723_12350 [Rhizobiaceae bacterium]|nr:hypothetical protein [Rhizobiaceae bacterium]
MVLDDEAPFSFDWARKAAQAVVAHARFMDWVERPKPGGDAIGAESPGLDHRSAVSAYGEFGADEPATSAAASLPSLVVMRGPEPGR